MKLLLPLNWSQQQLYQSIYAVTVYRASVQQINNTEGLCIVVKFTNMGYHQSYTLYHCQILLNALTEFLTYASFHWNQRLVPQTIKQWIQRKGMIHCFSFSYKLSFHSYCCFPTTQDQEVECHREM